MASLIEPLHPNLSLGKPSPTLIAETVLAEEELPLFVQRHSGNGRPYISDELIRYHFGASGRGAKRARQLLLGQLTNEDLERYAGEEWSPSG